MLEVRFSEVKRSALKQIGFSWFVSSDGGKFSGAIGGGASADVLATTGHGALRLGAITDSFGDHLAAASAPSAMNFNATLDALERKGAITTLAEPTLVALSGETASFLAGGEFPVPVVQNSGGGGGNGSNAHHRRMEAVRRQPRLHADRARRRGHQHDRRSPKSARSIRPRRSSSTT